MKNNSMLYLVNAANDVICCLNGVHYDSVSYTESLLDFDTLSFTVDKYIDIDGKYILTSGYDGLQEMMYIYLSGLNDYEADPSNPLHTKKGLFRISSVETSNDGFNESKSITCDSCECELNNHSFTTKINTGEIDSAEYLADGNVDDATGLAKEYVTIYNADNPSLSLINLALEELPYWSVGYVDPLVRNKKYSFDVGSKPIYSFLMNDVATAAKVIFKFDTVDRTVNIYSIERVDELGETNIFITYRNLLNSVDISPSNEGVYTRFNVAGADDLSIASVNFNEPKIENLLHLLNSVDSSGNPIYADSSIVNKYKSWYEYRYGENGKRAEFVELSKQYNQSNLNISEIENRLPSDALDYEQYDSMDAETLNSLLTQYIIVANGLAKDYTYTDGNGDLLVDDDGLAIIQDETGLKSSAYWEDYKIYTETIIPNIKIAIQNLTLGEDEKIQYIDNFETDWDLYGTVELSSKLSALKAKADVLADTGYVKSWDELTNDEKSKWVESSYNIYHNQYIKYRNQYDVCYIALEGSDSSGTVMYKDSDGYYLQRTDGTQYYFDSNWELLEISILRNGVLLIGRKQELENEKQSQSSIKLSIDALINDVSIENEQFGFSNEELNAIRKLRKDSDYVNENILTTSLDDIVSQINAMEELYSEAVDELDIESQPQYSFSTSLDNLFNLPVFKNWRGDFLCGCFIRVGLTDTEHIKLRIISITRNPCVDIDNTLEIEFSNMLRGKSVLSDYTNLFESAITSSINQITSTYTKNIDASSIYLNENILRAIANSSIFASSVTNLVSSSITAKDGVFDVISSNYISTDEFEARLARIGSLDADSAFIKYLESNLIVAGEIDVDTLKASLAQIDVAEIGDTFTNTLTALISTTSKSTIDDAYIQSAIVNKLYVGDLLGGTISTNKFTISSDNGAIRIEDSTQVWKDANGNVRMQAGLDANGDFTFSIYDETGTGILIDSTGVKDGAIADNLVTERMMSDNSVSTATIQNNAITAGKIDWSSFSEYVNAEGSNVIDISEFIVNEGGLSYKLGTLLTKVDDLEKQTNISVVIETSSVIYEDTAITLTGHVFNYNTDITDEIPEIKFSWHRLSGNTTEDAVWDTEHTGVKSVVINSISDTTTYSLDVDYTDWASSQ